MRGVRKGHSFSHIVHTKDLRLRTPSLPLRGGIPRGPADPQSALEGSSTLRSPDAIGLEHNGSLGRSLVRQHPDHLANLNPYEHGFAVPAGALPKLYG